jgi:hypothetical protein
MDLLWEKSLQAPLSSTEALEQETGGQAQESPSVVPPQPPLQSRSLLMASAEESPLIPHELQGAQAIDYN